ncbi:hypothetical protein D3C81_1098250 [compost metagenome]
MSLTLNLRKRIAIFSLYFLLVDISAYNFPFKKPGKLHFPTRIGIVITFLPSISLFMAISSSLFTHSDWTEFSDISATR